MMDTPGGHQRGMRRTPRAPQPNLQCSGMLGAVRPLPAPSEQCFCGKEKGEPGETPVQAGSTAMLRFDFRDSFSLALAT